MRKTTIIILTLIACMHTYAQQSQSHWIGVAPTMFTTLQIDDSHITSSKLGAGAGLGMTYEFQMNNFVLAFGAEATYNYYHVGLADVYLSYEMIDTKGTPFQYKGAIEKRRDISHTLDVRIPVMVGLEFKYIYMMTGIKLHVNVAGSNQSIARLTTSGKYDMFYDEITNVPSHGFIDNQFVKTNSDFKYGLDVRPTIELGVVISKGRYNNHYNNKYHLGVYAEYGLINVLPSDRTAELMMPDVSQYLQVDMNHVYITPNVSQLHHFQLGIRFKTYFKIRILKGRLIYY